MQDKTQSYNWVARLTGFFIGQKQLSVMLVLLIVGLGMFALLNLRREGFPQVPVKLVVISTVYRGAGSAEVEQAVTNPLEDRLKEVGDIKELQSTSSDNASTIQAIIEPDANLDAVTQDITSKVGGVALPKEVEEPTVFVPQTGEAAFVYGLSGPLGDTELLAQGTLFARELSQIKGVKTVEQSVELSGQVRVTFDAAKLNAAGINTATLIGGFEAANLSLPGGQLASGDRERSVLFAGRLTSVEQLAALPLQGANGAAVPLRDVATIEQVVDSDDKVSRYGYNQNGTVLSQRGLVYNVSIRDDADIIDMQKRLEEGLERLQQERIVSNELKIVNLVDNAEVTNEQIKEIEAGAFGEKWDFGEGSILSALGAVGFLFGGIWLLALSMALFVNIRAALVAALSVPLSFLVTVIALQVQGVTLNTLTLFSMILVLGLVVDPVIVVLEALQRYKDRGYRGLEAVMKAVDSVGLGVLMAVMISAIVFTPFGIVSGTFGEIIKFIPITVIPALVASFFIPVLFLTSIGNRLLKSHPSGGDQSEEASLWRVSLWFQRVNRGVLRRWWAQLGIMALAVIIPFGITGFLFGGGYIKNVQFSSPSDTESILVSVSYPPDSTIALRDELVGKVEAELNKLSEAKNYYYYTQDPGSLSIFVNLSKVGTRERTATEIADELDRTLPQDGKTQFARADTLSAGPPEQEFPVSLQIYDNDPAKLREFSIAAADYLKGREGVVRVSDGYRDGGGELIQVVPKRQELAQAGLTPAALGSQVASLTGELPLTKLQTPGGETEVVAAFGSAPAGSAEALRGLTVGGERGPTTLGAVADVSVVPAAGTIAHFNGNRYATVKAQLDADADQFALQADLKKWAEDNRQRFGLRADAFESKGEGDEIAKSFTELFQALIAAILLTYVVLAVFFRSFLQPIIITFAVPLSFIGVFPSLVAFNGGQFGFLEILGLITLVGIVENVGIFVIDYANRRVREGVDHRDAIALATAVRFRPIFLTKICAIGSLLPLAVISPFWRGLAAVIVAGILTSGITSLFTTPILYHWFHKLSNLRSRGSNSRPARMAARASKPFRRLVRL